MNKIDETISTYLVDRNDFSHETMESASLAFLDAYGCILDAFWMPSWAHEQFIKKKRIIPCYLQSM